MNKKNIKDLVVGDAVEMFLLVSSMSEKVATSKKPYVEFVLEDGTTKISGKIWNTKIEDLNGIAVGEVMKLRAKVGEYKGLQLIIDICRAVTPEDGIDVNEFVRKTPVPGEEMFDFIMGVVNNFNNSHLKLLTSTILTENKVKLMYFPGAMTVHHDLKSGLLYHIYRMLQTGIKTAEVYPNVNQDLLYTGVILHDIGKLEELGADEEGKADDYTMGGKMLGHLVQGIKIVAFASRDLNIPEEVSLLVEHMISSHHGEESYGNIKKAMFLEASILQHLDMIDSKTYMFTEVIDSTKPCEFSEKKFFLGNVQVYNHNL